MQQLKWIEFKCDAYESIALHVLYIVGFCCVKIGWNSWPQTPEFQECAIGVAEFLFRAFQQLTEGVQCDTGLKLYELYLCKASTKLCIFNGKRESRTMLQMKLVKHGPISVSRKLLINARNFHQNCTKLTRWKIKLQTKFPSLNFPFPS